jgi:hypothetical protein
MNKIKLNLFSPILFAGGVFFSWQRTSGGYLATTGYDQVNDRLPYGKQI